MLLEYDLKITGMTSGQGAAAAQWRCTSCSNLVPLSPISII